MVGRLVKNWVIKGISHVSEYLKDTRFYLKKLKTYRMKPCDHNIVKAIELATQMIRLAERGDIDREDIGCGILYGVLRDSGYKLKLLGEKEKEAHIQKGWWDKSEYETN
jgi:hypothetical protein